MSRVPVLIAEPYTVVIEHGVLRRAGEEMVAVLKKPTRVFVLTVAPVRKPWGEALQESLKQAGLEAEFVEMPDGERHKTMTTVESLAAKLIKAGADRGSAIVAFGGGVVGDVAGFLASIYMRGIPVVQIPTTLLAQVDASVGGKTGVNTAASKNLLGTFYQPKLVLSDPEVLATLPDREFRSGLYEVMKCGVIRNPAIFEFMEREREKILQRDPQAIEWLITEGVRVKAEVVAADESESGERKYLNFGHTIGHALESDTSYKTFLHGEAVAWGMIAASMIAAAMQRASSETAQRIIATVLAYAHLPKVESRAKNVVKRLIADKKTLNGKVNFILPIEIGKVELVSEVPERALHQAVEELRYLSSL